MSDNHKTNLKVPRASSGKRHGTQQSLNSAVKSICDVMRRSNCAGAMKYVPELTWILFLRILDERETHEAEEAEALGISFSPSLQAPYRWRDWAAPESAMRQDKNAKIWDFVHGQLLPHLKALEKEPGASARQKIISEVMSGVERSRIDSEKNFLDVIDKVHELSNEAIDQTHVFTLSQVYEGLLLKMGEKGNDGGQFFTPRDTIRVMIRAVNPQIGKTVYDPGCGTGGFLAQAYEYMREEAEKAGTLDAKKLETLKRRTFYGREKDNDVYPIALANLILHGIDEPHIWHGNTLSGQESYGELFKGAPQFFDYVLMNPPFGGKEGKEAQTFFDYPTSATQVLFIQHVMKSMKDGSVCGIVLDEGVLFRANEGGFVKTKRKLLEDCDVYCIVSLPGGVFSSAGAGVKTNLVFFRKGKETEKIWYYDLSDVKVGKKKPLTQAAFDDFFKLLPTRGDSPRSWTIDFRKASPGRPRRSEALQRKSGGVLRQSAGARRGSARKAEGQRAYTGTTGKARRRMEGSREAGAGEPSQSSGDRRRCFRSQGREPKPSLGAGHANAGRVAGLHRSQRERSGGVADPLASDDVVTGIRAIGGPMTTHRSTASFGKRQEYIAVAELLRRGFDVYMTLVDDQQIDCVIRQELQGQLRYLDIQIKARSSGAQHAGTFAALTIRNPRPDFWFIFYSETLNTYWVMPSLEVIRLANQNKGGESGAGKNLGKYTIKFANELKGGWSPRPKFKQFENAFELLESPRRHRPFAAPGGRIGGVANMPRLCRAGADLRLPTSGMNNLRVPLAVEGLEIG